jgi:hypothetical protein
MLVFLVIGTLILACGTYAIWPSRYNISAHMSLAMCINAFVIPAFLTPIAARYSADVVSTFALIVFCGAIFYLVGILVGYLIFPGFSFLYYEKLLAANFLTIRKAVSKRICYWAIFAIIVMILSFCIIGFIPAFAADPLSAKYFRGQYQESYSSAFNASIIYRVYGIGLKLTTLLIPLLLCLWLEKKKISYLFFAALAVAIASLTLSRGQIGAGIIMVCGIYAVRRGRKAFITYLICLPCIYCAGALLNYTLYAVFNLAVANTLLQKTSLAQLIANGTGDFADGLSFMEKFHFSPEYTYGRTLIGGLVPHHYYWNPAIWNLHIVEPNLDVNDIVSGGLRLPLPLWGYVAFGWIGALLIPLLNGCMNGLAIRYTKCYMQGSKSYVHLCFVLLLYVNFYGLFYDVSKISNSNLPAVFVMFSIMGIWRKKHRYLTIEDHYKLTTIQT